MLWIIGFWAGLYLVVIGWNIDLYINQQFDDGTPVPRDRMHGCAAIMATLGTAATIVVAWALGYLGL